MAKVCVIGPSKKFFSGMSVYTICLANALSVNNDVSVVLLRNLLARLLYPGKWNVGRDDQSVGFLAQIHTYDGLDWNSPLSWLRAYRFLKQQEPDVIIMLWWTSVVAHMQLAIALANRLKIKAKLILEIHEILGSSEESILPIRLYARMMSRLLSRSADVFVVHSAAVKNQVVETYGLKGDRGFVIPHALYNTYYKDYNKQVAKDELGIEEEFTILHFGMIRRYKGISYLVQAFDRLPQDVAQHSRLIIAGEDWGDDSSLVALIAHSPYKDYISFQPMFVPDDMIPKYFSAADVVVLPYLRTSGSGVANIAMAYGKPIITTDLDPMRECLQDYQGAAFVPVGDSTALRDELLEIYTQYKRGQAIVYDRPQSTWDETARRFECIIDQHCNFIYVNGDMSLYITEKGRQ